MIHGARSGEQGGSVSYSMGLCNSAYTCIYFIKALRRLVIMEGFYMHEH